LHVLGETGHQVGVQIGGGCDRGHGRDGYSCDDGRAASAKQSADWPVGSVGSGAERTRHENHPFAGRCGSGRGLGRRRVNTTGIGIKVGWKCES
jgi:hypothetical protein